MVHGELDEANQRRRQHLPLQREIVCRTSVSVAEFNRLLNLLLIKHIEGLKQGYSLRADRTGRDGCYNATNPISYWSLHTSTHKRPIPNWIERLVSLFSTGSYVGEIVTEPILLGRLRLRFYILDHYWKDLEAAINATYDDMLSGNEGFDIVTGDDSRKQIQPTSMKIKTDLLGDISDKTRIAEDIEQKHSHPEEPKIPSVKSELRRQIEDLFNIEDIRSICFDLGIDYDNIRGETKEGKVRELLIYVERRNEIQRLIARCRELRPKANWDDYNLHRFC